MVFQAFTHFGETVFNFSLLHHSFTITWLVVSIVAGSVLLCCCCCCGLGFFIRQRAKNKERRYYALNSRQSRRQPLLSNEHPVAVPVVEPIASAPPAPEYHEYIMSHQGYVRVPTSANNRV